MFADNQDSLIADYNDNGDEEIFKSSAKDIAWQIGKNDDIENEDAFDSARTNHDSNDTFVVARTCRNSIQGKALIVDERGFVCSRSELLPTGCCSLTPLKKAKDEDVDEAASSGTRRKRYSCDTCNPQGCCAIYEYCVSCCLQPSKRRGKKNMGEKERTDNTKGRARGEDAIRPRLRNLDRFQICLATCRTSSASVRHENTYKDPDSKHCYSQYQKHRRDENLLKNNNGDNSIVVVTSFSTLRLFIRQRPQHPILATVI
ncbi:SREBP regulating gene protein isoform X2 [Venturia canescens]|nr:SREBP regulating gene protein isoform X2 [Venturia canescens]